VKTEGRGETENKEKKAAADRREGEKRRWFQFLGGWSSPTSASGPASGIHWRTVLVWGRTSQRGLHTQGSGASAPTASNCVVQTGWVRRNYAPSFLGSAVLVSQPTLAMVLVQPSNCLGVSGGFPILRSDHFTSSTPDPSCLVVLCEGMLFGGRLHAHQIHAQCTEIGPVPDQCIYSSSLAHHYFLTKSGAVNDHQGIVQVMPLSEIVIPFACQPLGRI
jgi:hypothetical protein